MCCYLSVLFGVESCDIVWGGEVLIEIGGVEGDFEWKDECGIVVFEFGVGV